MHCGSLLGIPNIMKHVACPTNVQKYPDILAELPILNWKGIQY